MNHATEFVPVECLCIPKALFFDKRYEDLSVDAKILYSLLLDRKEMAVRNGWIDRYGAVYVLYSREEMEKHLNVPAARVERALAQLEAHDQMVAVARPYKGRADQIYVRDITAEQIIEQEKENMGRKNTREKKRKQKKDMYCPCLDGEQGMQGVVMTLTAENIKTVAEVAEKYGHGYVHMTSRQGIEIPFIKVEDINVVKEELAKGGVGTGVCGPRVRTVTACQGSEICPSGCIDTYTLAKELDERYFGRELPHKFKFGVTGCQNNCLKAEENDVGIKGGMTVECSHDDCIQCGVCVKACREGALSMEDGRIVIDRDKCNNCARCVKSCPTDAWKGTPGYIVSFGGLFGNHIYKGEQLVPIIRDKETLFRVTDAAISFFEKHANGGERFRLTLQRVGEEEFKKEIQAAYEGK